MEPLKPYKKGFDYSYTLGAFPTYELIKTKPEFVRAVYIHTSYTDKENVLKICRDKNIKVLTDDKLFHKISDKENCFVIGVLNKFESVLHDDKSHLVLVNPSNMGILGTILRTALGVGIKDIALITPCADVF